MFDVLTDKRLHEFVGGQPLELEPLRDRYRALARGQSADGTQSWLNWIVRHLGEDRAVGTVQATLSRGDEGLHAVIAWVVGTPWQGRGIAGEAAVILVRWLERRGIDLITANIHPRHVASQKVALRAGLRVTSSITEEGEQVWRRQPDSIQPQATPST